LAFYGTRDELARGATVRAITRAAPHAEVAFVPIQAGHFGIVVGTRASELTWPTVAEWIHFREGTGPEPAAIRARPPKPRVADDEPEGAGFDVDVDLDLFVDAITGAAKQAWRRLGDLTSSATDAVDGVRFQEPRLRKLSAMTDDTRTSAGLALAERAKKTPEDTFFLWQGRAFTYRDADTRVRNVVRGLFACGVRPGDRVGVVMGSRPSFLSVVTAIGRLGAVAVVSPPDPAPSALRDAFAAQGLRAIVADPPRVDMCRGLGVAEVLVLGGGRQARAVEGATDMEAIDPDRVELPADMSLDAGRAKDLALVLLRPTDGGALRAAPVTNHRWALSALGAAAACTLKPEDTVYAPLPLHHPAGVLVSVGAALVAGSRLALGARFDVETFFPEARRYGATVVFYAGEMLRPLLALPPSRGDRSHSIRLFSGSGMRPDLQAKLSERFGAGIMEFYASTTQHVIMANASGEKVGSLGRRLPGSVDTTLARIDLVTREVIRDERGRLMHPAANEPGILLAEVTDAAEPATFEGAFEDGDRWFMTGDVVRRDEDGDLWFVDSLSGFVTHRGPGGAVVAVSTRSVEDALYGLPEIELAAAFDGGDGVVAAIVTRDPPPSADRIAHAFAGFSDVARPKRVVRVEHLPLTDGYRPDKRAAKELAKDASVVYSASQTSEPLRT
ncbi:MAG TPA: AMP-binding protein, partial [Polyangiaceae bacterium]|nr:AMP-binding protein [Polyangiaceae bacterium]